ncbi:hypothetical protein [Streptomyces sp. 3N207]|uniref:hypothetical protein n=1 Tax=Streptomyces sp. 3N207 TaxID=3457417 RepID=UPI003FD2B16B
MKQTRYERTLHLHGGLAAAMSEASRAARDAVAVRGPEEEAIRDVAAGVAAPLLSGYVLWVLEQARTRELGKLCFLSRDAQVLHEIAGTLLPALPARDGLPELRYVYSSRRTWSLAASDASQLADADWLFNSFIRSNAADVCARLGLDPDDAAGVLDRVGASREPDARADCPKQNAALRRFVAQPEIAQAAAPRIERMRRLVREYADQEGMASATTGLVDAGWTGRMVGALHTVLADAELPLPHVYFWGHEHRATGGVDLAHLSPYMYSTAGEPGTRWRVPDVPYIVETFCMSDHSIVSGYRRADSGKVVAELEETNAAVSRWGFVVCRDTVRAFAAALAGLLSSASAETLTSAEEVRPVLAQVLREFWLFPEYEEAAAWGAYPFDSDPVGRSALPLARPFSPEELAQAGRGQVPRGDRAWLQGSLALSGEPGRRAAAELRSEYERLGSPATD